MIRQWLSRFMIGRYGSDQLNITLVVLCLILYFLGFFTRWVVLNLIWLALLSFTLFRALSHDVERRRGENLRFLLLTRPICRGLKYYRCRVRDREHRYFKCPNCGQQMRVPRGKGRITVHCRSCGSTFEEKS